MLKLLKFVPLQLVFFLIVGILLSNYFVFPPEILFKILFGLILLIVFFYFISNKQSNNSFHFNLMAYVFVMVIGMVSFSSQTAFNYKNHYANFEFKKDSLNEFKVIVAKILKANNYNFKYEVDLEQLNGGKTKGKLLLSIQKDSLLDELEIDDALFLKSNLEEINKPKNPSEFNYKKYLENQQIYHQIRISKKDFLKIENSNKTLKGLAFQIRKRINTSLKIAGFNSNELAVINALLLGQRQTIDDDLLENYVNAGAIHILAVSGLHIGIILIILQFLLRPLRMLPKGKFIITIVSLITLWLYAVLAGLSPSIVRAVTMFSALVIGLALNKPSNVYNSLFISMLILLLIHPFYIFEVGFQLSYLAVFFIVWLQPKISTLWKPKYKIVNYFWQLFTVSLAAQIGVGVLSMYYFHQFPGLFFISNLIIIPVLGLILLCGIVVIVLSLFDVLPSFLAESYMFIIKKMNHFVSFVGQQESFIAENISISFIQLLFIYAAIIVFVIWLQTKKYYQFIVFLSVLLIIFSINIYNKYVLETTSQFVVFQKNAQSLIGFKKSDSAQFYTSNNINISDYVLKNYLLNERIKNVEINEEKEYFFNFEGAQILIINENGLYKFNSIKPTIIVLQNSPKINIERVLQFHNPKLVIVDGSNYKSFVERWSKTCLKAKTPFYSTLQKGAYILKND